MDRCHGTLTFRLTQVLTGHGCFGKYLCQVAGREPTTDCHHCDSGLEDTAEHTVRECTAWTNERAELTAAIGVDLSLHAIFLAMVSSRDGWTAVKNFCEVVMEAKEVAERQREATSNLAIRRRRPGRRRRDFNRQIPP